MSVSTTRYKDAVDRLIARGCRVINYDQRGCGSSDRDCDDWSLEPQVNDLEAVIDRVAEGERCALVAATSGGPPAIAYAARYPERVSHLVLRNAFANGTKRHEALLGVLVTRALRPVLKEHRDFWEMFTVTLANALTGFTGSERAREEAEAYRTGMSPEAYLALSETLDRTDVTDLLGSVQAPTLVVNDTAYRQVGIGWGPVAREITSRIPNARLVTTEDFPSTLEQFLHENDEPLARAVSQDLPSGTAIILFADFVDSTAHTERIGDAAFRGRARKIDDALRTAITEAGGTPIDGKLLGDGVLATFPSASQAIDAALRCAAAGDDGGLPLHLGIHAGDVIREQNNVYGGAVNIASRISGLSAPGEVLVSDIVRGLARTSAGVAFEDRGEHALKGVADPQRVYAVRKAGA
jgi:class 3 adenylate cyclase